jgi:surface antigen
MRRRLVRACLPFLILPMAAGCTSMGRETLGLGAGAPVSAGAAALGDGLIGRDKGSKLSSDARMRALDAEYQALQFMPAGQAVPWEAGSIKGSVVPTQLYRVGSQDCRGYSQTVVRDGREAKTLGTACRTEDGFWKPVA